jgi:sarcosine oxidase, subunit beta
MVETTDVIVIGAGVQGASLAFHLARRGVGVIVVERGSVAAGATGRSSGLVRMHYDLLADARNAHASLPWFQEWGERVGGDCGFTTTGFVQLVSAAKSELLRANVVAQQAIGIRTEVVTAERIRELAPVLDVAEDEVGAYEPDSGYADPSATAAGFIRAARESGARLVQGAEVLAIGTAAGAITGVATSKGSFSAPVVVDAAGAWAARVAGLAGMTIPVGVWRHDVAYLGAPPSVPIPFPVVIDDVNAMYFRPEGSELVLAALEDHTENDGSPDRETDSVEAAFPERVTDRMIRRVPGLRDGTYRSAHSGQDGLTPDEHPILGSVGTAGPAGFYLDCGHSGTGFKTAPAIGLAMAELILDGAPRTVDLGPYSLERFATGRLLVGEHSYGAIWR